MRRTILLTASLLLVPVLGPRAIDAQSPEPLQVGAVAPDFSLPGAVRHGILAEPISLSDYAGQTVVLAFFFKARTRG